MRGDAWAATTGLPFAIAPACLLSQIILGVTAVGPTSFIPSTTANSFDITAYLHNAYQVLYDPFDDTIIVFGYSTSDAPGYAIKWSPTGAGAGVGNGISSWNFTSGVRNQGFNGFAALNPAVTVTRITYSGTTLKVNVNSTAGLSITLVGGVVTGPAVQLQGMTANSGFNGFSNWISAIGTDGNGPYIQIINVTAGWVNGVDTGSVLLEAVADIVDLLFPPGFSGAAGDSITISGTGTPFDGGPFIIRSVTILSNKNVDVEYVQSGTVPASCATGLASLQSAGGGTTTGGKVVLGPIACPAPNPWNSVVQQDGTFQVGLHQYSAATLQPVQQFSLANCPFGLPGATPGTTLYIASTGQLYLPNSNKLYAVSVNRASGQDSTLGDVVTDLCVRCGLSQDDIDVSYIQAQIVHGYLVPRQMTAAAAMTPLGQTYFFDVVESGLFLQDILGDGFPKHNLRFVNRAQQQPIATLTEDDLGVADVGASRDKVPKLVETDTMENEMPAEIEVVYSDIELDYQQGHQYARRITTPAPTMFAMSPQKVSIPIALHASEALAVADFILYDGFVQRRSYQFATGPKWAKIEPGDVVTLVYKGLSFGIRIMRTELGLNWQTQFTAVSEENTIYVPSTNSQNALAGGAGSQALVSPTMPAMALLDITNVNDSHIASSGGLYVRLGGYTQVGFTGAYVEVSYDLGSTFNVIGSGLSSVWGSAMNNPPTGFTLPQNPDTYPGQFIFDKMTQLTVKNQAGTLASVSEAVLLASLANMFVWGSEVIQAATVTLLANGQYVLSDLLRGLRGTEWAMATHGVADPVTPVNQLVHLLLKSQGIGATLIVRSTTQLPLSVQLPIAMQNNDLKPHSPVCVIGSRDNNGNLTVTWIRRDRAESQWQDFVGTITQSEASESYDVDVVNPLTGATIRHLAQAVANTAVTTPTIMYTAAQQASDFGILPSYVTLYIYQNSQAIGRGIPAQVTV